MSTWPWSISLLFYSYSAGVGRTGTFITLDVMLQRISQEDSIDVFGFVRQMRFQRNFMVQTEVSVIHLKTFFSLFFIWVTSRTGKWSYTWFYLLSLNTFFYVTSHEFHICIQNILACKMYIVWSNSLLLFLSFLGAVRVYSRCPPRSHYLRSNWSRGQRPWYSHTGTSTGRSGNRLHLPGKRVLPAG